MSFWYAFIDTILPFGWLEPNFMKNALLAVLVAAPLFGTLGSFVVSNKMSFFSDAIGHSALTGIAFGVLLGIKEPMARLSRRGYFAGRATNVQSSKILNYFVGNGLDRSVLTILNE